MTPGRQPGRERRVRPGPAADRAATPASWPASARDLEKLATAAKTAGDPAARLRRPDRGRRQRRQGLGPGHASRSAACSDLRRPPCRWSAIRACGPASIPRSSRCCTGCRRSWPATGRQGKQIAGPLRPHRAARRQRTLTLAEVEVYSDGRNVARQGKATQKNTGYGGDASRAIDGNTSGNYSNGGQTHTEENTPNPGGKSTSAPSSRSSRS